MKKLLLSTILLLCSFSTVADERVVQKVDQLVSLLNDLHSSEYKKSRKYQEVNGRYILSSFTLQGFNRGNNWTGYLAIFGKTRHLDKYGENTTQDPEYYLIGVTELYGKFKPSVDLNSAQYKYPLFTFDAKTRDGKPTEVKVQLKGNSITVVNN